MIITIIFIYISRDNRHGALNIYNSPNVMVKNCSFYNNTSDGNYTNTPFRANGGGLSISYNTEELSNINIFVTNCIFMNNVAMVDLALRSSINRLFRENLFSGRGGGLSIIFNVTSPINCTVSDCEFINNTARSLSGGLYSAVGKACSDQTYYFSNNTFIGNSATLSGAFNFGIIVSRNRSTVIDVTIYNCTFKHNRANIAGSSIVYFYDGLANVTVKFQECNFTNNTALSYAGAIDVVSYNFFAFRNSYPPVEFINW